MSGSSKLQFAPKRALIDQAPDAIGLSRGLDKEARMADIGASSGFAGGRRVVGSTTASTIPAPGDRSSEVKPDVLLHNECGRSSKPLLIRRQTRDAAKIITSSRIFDAKNATTNDMPPRPRDDD